jgi:hypothetical protein
VKAKQRSNGAGLASRVLLLALLRHCHLFD